MNLRKTFNSFKFALKGLRFFFQTQNNARFHLLAAIAALMASYYFKISNMEWCLVVFCIGIVLASEALNTSIEQLTDLVSPEWNAKAGLVKDLAAGAVLISAFTAFIIGGIIFIPKVITAITQ